MPGPSDQDILNAFHGSNGGSAPSNDDAILNAFRGNQQDQSVTAALLGKLGNMGSSALNTGVNAAQALGQDIADTGRGVAQGASFGLAPVAAGAGEATYDQLHDLVTGEEGQSWLENYRKHQQESNENFKEAKERSPWLYHTGQLGGALGTGLLTAGAAPELSLGGSMLRAGLTGAGVGAVTGAAESDGNLTDSEGNFDASGAMTMLADAGGGAIAGGVTGAGIAGAAHYVSPLLSKMASKVGDKMGEVADQSRWMRQAASNFQRGLEGTEVSNSSASSAAQGIENADAVRELTDRLLQAKETLGKPVNELIKKATDQGVIVDTQTPAMKAIQKLEHLVNSGSVSDPQAVASADAKISDLIQSKFAPDAIDGVLGQIKGLITSTAEKDPNVSNVLTGLASDLNKSLSESYPGLAEARQRFNEFSELIPETIIRKGVEATPDSPWMSEMNDPQSKLYGGVKNILSHLETSGAPGTESGNTLNDVVVNLQKLERKYPGIQEQTGLDPFDLAYDAQNKADRFATTKAVTGAEGQTKSPLTSWQSAFGAETGKGNLYHAANIAGRALKNINESPVADMGRSLYNMPDQGLNAIAQKLKAAPGIGKIGEWLERSLTEKNEAIKNAALFSILQNPKARLLISGDDVKE